jgi:dihydroneopterin aldolase
VNLKKALYLLNKRQNNQIFRDKYKLICKKLKNSIKESKRDYYNKLMANSANKIKTTWSIIKSLTGKVKKQETIHTLCINGSVITDPQIISNSFNEYFVTVVDIFYKKNNTDLSQATGYLYDNFGKPFQTIKYKFTSYNEIEKIVQNLKISNACGYDEISSRVIKACSKTISSPLSHICNQALAKGTFPSRLKFSIVKPLYKKGNKESISNYRPISLLPSFSKILEKVIFNRLYQHCIDNNILSFHQYGFKLGSSTE